MATNSQVLEWVRNLPPGDLSAVADDAGVALGTLMKIHYGSTQNPRMQTLDALADYFAKERVPRMATDFHDPTSHPQTIGVRPPISAALIAPTE